MLLWNLLLQQTKKKLSHRADFCFFVCIQINEDLPMPVKGGVGILEGWGALEIPAVGFIPAADAAGA